MADTDPWLNRTWKVYAVQGTGGPYLKPSDKEGAFTLSAVPSSVAGQTAYYTVDFVGENMPPCWQGLLLFPHGSVAFAPPYAAAADVDQERRCSMARRGQHRAPGTQRQHGPP